jgi:outer membrane immunogenic protein
MGTSFCKLLVAAGAVLCAASSAFAQGQPRVARVQPAPVVQSDPWSGAYIGFVVGAAVGHSSATNVVDCAYPGFLCAPGQYPQNGALLGATASGTTSDAAFTGGILAGHNWRRDRIVYGVETDISYLHLRLTSGGSASSLNLGLNNGGAPPVPVVATVGTTAGMDWLATFRGRAGYLVRSDLLVFATGGLALTNQSVSYSYVDNWIFNGGAAGSSRTSQIAAGYAAGAGIDWIVSGNWTLRAEYLHAGFGTQRTSGFVSILQLPLAKSPYVSSANLSADLFRTGLTYKF